MCKPVVMPSNWLNSGWLRMTKKASAMLRYRRLDVKDILGHTETLSKRVKERFPNRGLTPVCQDLYSIAKKAQDRIERISRPNIYLRFGIGIFVMLTLFLVITGFARVDFTLQSSDLLDITTLIETGIQDMVFIGAGIYFLINFENRIKRNHTLDSLNELRELAHVIDMHQLIKDPEHILLRGTDTESSPKKELNAFLLSRYLDYCSEMLSIIGKVAALYVQDFDDNVTLAAVNEIEGLVTGLSRKIWQKIMIIHQLEESI